MKLFQYFTTILLVLFVANGYSQKTQTIPINTKNTSLILSTKKDNILLFHYYGKRVNKPENIVSKVQGIEYYKGYGIKSEQQTDFRITHGDGNLSTQLVFDSVSSKEIKKNVMETTIKLYDLQYPIKVKIIIKAYLDDDVLSQHIVFSHSEPSTITLFSFNSIHLPIKAHNYYLTHFHSNWVNEMQLVETKVNQGSTVSVEAVSGTMTTRFQNPSFLVSKDMYAQENFGEVIGGHLAWPGNWMFNTHLDFNGILHIRSGMNPYASEYYLPANKEFKTPEFIFTYSDEGKGKISRNFHRWARKYGLRNGNELNRTLLNSWEGVQFNFDEKKINKQISKASELGVELYVLDDGWFGNEFPRNSDKAGLGDWQVNRKKLPSGIKGLTELTKRKGIDFGIWVEPEMVNPLSVLIKKHPEWVIRQQNRKPILNRNQLVLDLTNPKVHDFILYTMDDILKNKDISYVKWDSNRTMYNPGSTYLSPKEQSHLFIDYNWSLLDIFDKVVAKYPKITFQLCSGGGNRLDYGSLKYFDEFWTSDNTDPVDRVFMQWGTSHFFPAMAMGSHATYSPNHNTGRATSLKFRFDVAMSGRLGLEFDPLLINDEEKAFIKKCLKNYEKIRPIIQKGDLYRLVSPYDENYASLMIVTEDKSAAVLFAWQWHKHVQEFFPNIKLPSLNPNTSYKVSEINLPDGYTRYIPAKGEVYSGEYLTNVGIENKFNKVRKRMIKVENDSFVYVIEKQ